MDLVAFEHERDFVVGALREGHLDYLETVSEAAEAELFRYLIDRRILQRLAETCPTQRQKEEVPVCCMWPARSVCGCTEPPPIMLILT